MNEQDFKYHREELRRSEKYSFILGVFVGIGFSYLVYEWAMIIAEIWKK